MKPESLFRKTHTKKEPRFIKTSNEGSEYKILNRVMTEHPHYNKELLEKVLNWYTDYLCENISQSNRTVIRTLGYFRIHEKLIDNVRKISVRFRPLDSIRNYLANKGAATVKHEKKKTITIVEECE